MWQAERVEVWRYGGRDVGGTRGLAYTYMTSGGPVGEDKTSDWNCLPPGLLHLLSTSSLRKGRAGDTEELGTRQI